MTFAQFLVYLAGPGAAVAVSWLAEQFPAWHEQTPRFKFYFQVLAASVVACLAYAIGSYAPPDLLEAVAPYFGIVYAVVASVYANQKFHRAGSGQG